MRLSLRSLMLMIAVGLFTLIGPSTRAQDFFVGRSLQVSKVYSVREIEPGLVEMVLVLQDGTKTAVRMNIFTVRLLSVELNRFNM